MSRIKCTLMAWMIALSAMVCAAESESTKEQAANLDRAEQLISILNREYLVDPSTQDPNKKQEMYNDHYTRMTSATLELSKMGDPVVDKIVNTLRRYEYRGSKGDPRIVLMNIGTPKAQKALLDMALGRNGFEPSSGAAGYYAEMMREKKDLAACKVLLDSPDSSILSEALRFIEGIELDADSFEKVKKCLKRRSLKKRAIGVMSADPSSNLAEQKIQAIVESFNEVKDLPGGAFKGQDFLNLEHRGIGSAADDLYCMHLDGLCKVRGADEFIRKQIAVAPDGILKDCLMIAMAKRGDMAGARPSLQAFLKDPKYRTLSNMRRGCVSLFERQGDPQDIPFLKELAAGDPYSQEKYREIPRGFYEKWGDEYINLTEDQTKKPEEYLLPKMEKLLGYQPKPSRTTYPIRTAAQSAIKAIEERQKMSGQGK